MNNSQKTATSTSNDWSGTASFENKAISTVFLMSLFSAYFALDTTESAWFRIETGIGAIIFFILGVIGLIMRHKRMKKYPDPQSESQ